MARINSSAIGQGSGSAGVITYRTVRGRTIISGRVRENKSRTEKQVRHRAAFGEAQRLGKELKEVIILGFDKTEFGSEYNNFIKQNWDYLDYIRTKGGTERDSEPLHNLWLALRDKEFKGKVVAALGAIKVTASFRWDADGLPVAQVVHSRNFQAGDRVTFVFGVTGLNFDQPFSQLVTVEKVLEEADIAGFAKGQKAVFEKGNCAQLDFRGLLPEGIEEMSVVAAAIVWTPGGVRSTSYYTALPVLPVVCTATEHKYVSEGKMEVRFASAEVFPGVLAREAVGASLRFPGLTEFQSYAVTGFVADGNGQAIGFVAEDKANLVYEPNPLGEASEACPLSKDGRVIALISGLKTPNVMS